MITKRISGFTFTEAAISAAVMGIVSLSIVKVQDSMVKVNITSQNTQTLVANAQRILTTISIRLKQCGGISGSLDPTSGQTIIAIPSDIMNNEMSDILFFSKDKGAIGQIDQEDEWTLFSSTVVNTAYISSNGPSSLTTSTFTGTRYSLWERTYADDNWLDIRTPTDTNATLLREQLYACDAGVKINRLSFTLLDGQNPPRIAHQDPSTTSSVRISIELQKGDKIINQEKVVILERLIYGPG